MNIAEISSDNASSYGGDIDSVADLNPTNDVLIDLLVLPPDGLNDPAVDEDDHDVAIVELKRPAVTTLPISVQSPTLTLPATGRSSTGTTSALALALLVAGLAALYAARTQPDHR